ncbi:MAG: polyphosphate polymerase domain-containing protein [Lachnospiraceae bacterium]|nr:polyphosphate polymerase domain-containing protein [Lachnospiraceae bacterium]
MQKYRHEYKYLISEKERDILKTRLSEILEPDIHAKGGSYFIRSLYFDDFRRSAYGEKMDGTVLRKKYRIRVYNLSKDVISLECKRKRGNYIYKLQQRISLGELDSILNGDYAFLLKREEPLLREFYAGCISDRLRPEVIVDYERTPFVWEAGTVRITFDEHVRSGFMGWDLFDGDMPAYEVLEPGQLILEVKYTEFLPEILRRILPMEGAELMAASKYVLCCDQRDRIRGIPPFAI